MHTKNLGGHASRKSRVNELAKKFEVYASDEPLSIRPPSSNSTLTDTPNKLKSKFIYHSTIQDYISSIISLFNLIWFFFTNQKI